MDISAPMCEVLQAAFKGNTNELYIPSRFLSKMFTAEDKWPDPSMLCQMINDDRLYGLQLSDGTTFVIPRDKNTGKLYFAEPGCGGNGILLKNNSLTMAERLQQAYLKNKTVINIPVDFLENTGKDLTHDDVIQSHIRSIYNGTQSLVLSDKSYFKFPYNCAFWPKATTNGIMLYINDVNLNDASKQCAAISVKSTEEQRLIKLRDQAAKIMMETDTTRTQIYVILETQLKELYARTREIRGRLNDVTFELQSTIDAKLKARLQWEYNELHIELMRLVGTGNGYIVPITASITQSSTLSRPNRIDTTF